MTDNEKYRILIFCASGNIFNEIFKPIIEALNEKMEIHFLFRDNTLSDQNKKTIQDLYEAKKIASYKIIEEYSDLEGKYKTHKYLWGFIKPTLHTKFDLIILGGDICLFERYLLHLAKKQKSPTLVVQTCLAYRYLQKYLGKEEPKQLPKTKIASYYKKISLSQGLPNKIKILSYSFIVRLKKAFQRLKALKNHYIYPFIFTRTFFVPDKNDAKAFTSGRADAVVCYDPIEYEAIKTVIPTIKNLYIARHPLNGFCQCDIKKEPKTKLLVTFGGPWENKMSDSALNRWMHTIERAVKFLNVSEACLRFSPSCAMDNPQAIQIVNASKNLPCKVTIMDSLKTPLADEICNFICVIGAPSTVLKVARAACNKIIVVGLLKSGNEHGLDITWHLGKSEGINWVLENEELEKKHLILPELPYLNRPAVTDIINNEILNFKNNSSEILVYDNNKNTI